MSRPREPYRSRNKRLCKGQCGRDRPLIEFRRNASKCMDCAGTRPVVRDHEAETRAGLAAADEHIARVRAEAGL